MGLKITETLIGGVFVVESSPVVDARGSFSRFFCARELDPVLQGKPIVQINHSVNLEVGTIRGLHYQSAPHAETKMVRCIRGKVWDVTVDLREGSPTFLRYHAQELSAGNNLMMVIPEGCAHGYQVLEPNSELLYLHTDFYMPESQGAVRYNDPALRVEWPLPATNVSERDLAHSLIGVDFKGMKR